MEFPITSYLPAIVDTIKGNAVSLIVAPTGSGKSIAVPAAIVEIVTKEIVAATLATNPGKEITIPNIRCFVVVPTRTAAISLATFQEEVQRRKNRPGTKAELIKLLEGGKAPISVGSAAEGDIKYKSDTQIAYVTGGHARRKILQYFRPGKVAPLIGLCDVLIVDEIHAGTLDGTIIVSLWLTARRAGVNVPRLVLISATPIPIPIDPPAARFDVIFQTYPVKISYAERIIPPEGNRANFEAAQAAVNFHTSRPTAAGHILVFAAGKAEVDAIATEIGRLLGPRQSIKGIVLVASSTISAQQFDKIYAQVAPDERKIIVATNIAEMSITIEDIGLVVDTMLEKRAGTTRSGGKLLAPHYISKDSAQQRAGRTGRTGPGEVYRCMTQEQFAVLEEHRPPEIERVPLYESVINLLDVGLDPVTTLIGVPSASIASSLQLLVKLNMANISSETSPTVQQAGRFAAKFPLGVRNSSFLYNWLRTSYGEATAEGPAPLLPPFPGLVLTTILDSYGPSYLYYPARREGEPTGAYQERMLKHRKDNFEIFEGYSDVETLLKIAVNFIETFAIQGEVKIPEAYKVINWCNVHSLNYRKIKDWLTSLEECRRLIGREQVAVEAGTFTPANVIKVARPLLLAAYSDNVMIHGYDGTYRNLADNETYRLDNQAVDGFRAKPPIGIIAISSIEIQSRRGTDRIVNVALDTEVDASGNILSAPQIPGGRAQTQTRTRVPQRQASTSAVSGALAALAVLNRSSGTSQPNTSQPNTSQPSSIIIPESMEPEIIILPQPLPQSRKPVPPPNELQLIPLPARPEIATQLISNLVATLNFSL